MPSLDDLLDAFNLIDRVDGLLTRIVHADWHGASTRAGATGVAGELGRAIVGANEWSFQVPRASNWDGADIEAFLHHYSVIVWGRRVTSSHFIFNVKQRQANWAEYLLLRRGITLDGPLFNPANASYAKQHTPGDQPPAWADQHTKPQRPADGFLDFFG